MKIILFRINFLQNNHFNFKYILNHLDILPFLNFFFCYAKTIFFKILNKYYKKNFIFI